MASTSGINPDEALELSLDDVIRLQAQRLPRSSSNRDNVESKSFFDVARALQANILKQEHERLMNSQPNMGNDDRSGNEEAPWSQFNSNSTFQEGFSGYNHSSIAQRQQRLPQNHPNFFQRRIHKFSQNFKGKTRSSDHGGFCRNDCCYSKCMAQRRMLGLQTGLSGTLHPDGSQNGDNERGAVHGHLERSSSMSNLSGFGNRSRRGSCSCDTHVAPFLHFGDPSPHFSRSSSQEPHGGEFRGRSRSRSRSRPRNRSRSRSRSRSRNRSRSRSHSRSQNRSRSRSRSRSQNRSRSRSRSRSRNRSRSPSRSRSRDRGHYQERSAMLTRKNYILDPMIQQEIVNLKVEFEKQSTIRAQHCGADLVPIVTATDMTCHDRFASYYLD